VNWWQIALAIGAGWFALAVVVGTLFGRVAHFGTRTDPTLPVGRLMDEPGRPGWKQDAAGNRWYSARWL
jgi:hypothetical protein